MDRISLREMGEQEPTPLHVHGKNGERDEQQTPPSRLRRWFRTSLLAGVLLAIGGDTTTTIKCTPPLPTGGMVERGGKTGIPGTYKEELIRNPSLTTEEYLDLLARSLDTPEKLGQYLQASIQYVQEPEGKNEWQTLEETIQTGKGDCEEYAFLAQNILHRQGKNAHVVSNFRDHASCVWIQKRPNGRYDGYSFDDFGMDKNGEAGWFVSRPLGDTSPSPSEEGYESVLAALNGALSSHNGKEYSVNPYLIPVLRIRGCGLKHYDYLTIRAFDPDASALARISNIEAAALFALLGGGYAASRLWKSRGKGGTWKEYFTTFHLH